MMKNENYNLILKILLSLDSVIINNVLQEKNIIKVLVKYEIDKILHLLKVFLSNKKTNLNFSIAISNINTSYDIICLKFNNEIVGNVNEDGNTGDETGINNIQNEYYIYCFSYSLSKYIYNSNEGLFDCNLLFYSYANNYFIYEQFPISYEDLNNRKFNKKFCCLWNNFIGIENFLINNVETCDLMKKYFFNKINYSLKLIENGWLMDSFYLKEKSWTLNYWKNYLKYSPIIKFFNKKKEFVNEEFANEELVDGGLLKLSEKKCNLCEIKFNKDDIVFDINNIFMHYNCIITKLFT